jgi:NAD(P)-dependent dehydrogenase (short-subunit alcohol dehydrogenase family)
LEESTGCCKPPARAGAATETADECSDEGWELALVQNLTAAFHLCRAVIGRMLQQEASASGLRGSIVLTSSVLAFAPEPREFGTHAYAAAKGGLVALSRSMAAHYAPHGISVNCVAPGMVRTPAGESAMEDPKVAEIVRGRQQRMERSGRVGRGCHGGTRNSHR